jgi:hypothetical protein
LPPLQYHHTSSSSPNLAPTSLTLRIPILSVFLLWFPFALSHSYVSPRRRAPVPPNHPQRRQHPNLASARAEVQHHRISFSAPSFLIPFSAMVAFFRKFSCFFRARVACSAMCCVERIPGLLFFTLLLLSNCTVHLGIFIPSRTRDGRPSHSKLDTAHPPHSKIPRIVCILAWGPAWPLHVAIPVPSNPLSTAWGCSIHPRPACLNARAGFP